MTQQTCEVRVRCARNIFTVLGAIVGLLFAAQGVLVFVGPSVDYDEPPKDFWRGCRWLADGLLCILLGLGIFIFEATSCRRQVKTHLGWHFLNRFGLALVFLWVGLYAAGGAMKQGPLWADILGYVIGVTSWVLCLAHLILAGCADRAPPAENDDMATKSSGKKQQDMEQGVQEEETEAPDAAMSPSA